MSDLRSDWQKDEGRFGLPQKFRLGSRVCVRQDGGAPSGWCGDWAFTPLTVVGVLVDAQRPGRVEYYVQADNDAKREHDAFAEDWLEGIFT